MTTISLPDKQELVIQLDCGMQVQVMADQPSSIRINFWNASHQCIDTYIQPRIFAPAKAGQ